MPQTPYVLHVTAKHTAPEAPGTFGELTAPEHLFLADGHVICAVCPAQVITDEETPVTTLASLHCPKCGVRGSLRRDADPARAWVNLQNEETSADDWHSGPDVQCVSCACGHSFYQDGLDGSDPAPLRLTFAVGQIGPSGDGDGGSYFLTSLVRRDPAGTLTAQSLRDWAEAQLLSELKAQGQTPGRELAFVTFMGSEEETAEA